MQSKVTKTEINNAPIPVIGKELESDYLEMGGANKLSLIAVAAYYKAEARGYEPGHELQDWLDAEAEIIEKTREDKIK